MAHPSHDLGVRTLSTLILFPFGRKPLLPAFFGAPVRPTEPGKVKAKSKYPRAPIKQTEKGSAVPTPTPTCSVRPWSSPFPSRRIIKLTIRTVYTGAVAQSRVHEGRGVSLLGLRSMHFPSPWHGRADQKCGCVYEKVFFYKSTLTRKSA